MHFYRSIIALCAIGTGSIAGAQTVTVAKTGTPTYASVQAAIGHFATDPNPGQPNVIQITDNALYDEVVTVDVPVTIVGTAEGAPTIALQANVAGRAASSGMVVKLPSSMTTGTVSLQNLVLIPSKTSLPQSAAVHVANNNVFLHLNRVVISGNNGLDQPISTDGLTNVANDVDNHKHFGDDGIVAGGTADGEFEGDGVEILLQRSVITHLRGEVSGAGTSDGILIPNTDSTGVRRLRIEDDCVLSAMNGKGASVEGDIEIAGGTEGVHIVMNTSFGIWFNGESPNVRSIKNAIISGNQVGIYESTNSGQRVDIEDSIIATQSRQNFRMSGAATDLASFKRTTIANASGSNYETIRTDGAGPQPLYFEDCVVAGNGRNQSPNAINNITSGSITFVNTALVMAGPLSLNRPYGNYKEIVGKPVTMADPQFADITDFTSPNFYDVASVHYAKGASGNTPLSGGADYVGPAAPAAPTEQIITVSKAGGASFNTIQGALDSLVLDATKKYVIQITDSSVYDEMITMDVPATIIGTGASRPILAVQPNPAGFENDGALAGHVTVWSGDAGLLIDIPVESVTTCSIGLKNLIVIPSMTGTSAAAGIVNKDNNFYLEMENVLVSGNNGSNAPVATDPFTLVPEDGAHKHFKVSGGHIGSITNDRQEGDGVEVLMRNCVFTHIRGFEGDSWRSGFYMYRTYYDSPVVPETGTRTMAFRHLTIDDACSFTFNNGSGLRCASGLEWVTSEDRSYILNNQFTGLWLDMVKGASYVNGVIIAGNNWIGVNEGVGNSGPRAYVMNAIVANNGSYGSYNRLGSSTQTPVYYEKTTFANNAALNNHPQLQTSTNASTIHIKMVDSIFTGNGTGNSLNLLQLTSIGTFNMDHTAIVTEGPQSLNNPAFDLGTVPAVLVGEPASSADPMFVNTTDATSPDFYRVGNPAYATLNSTGGPLVGGGGALTSSVGNWTIY